MTIEEKLKHFQDICMEDARDRSSRMLDDYMKALEKTFEEHKQAERKNADLQVKLETEKLEREINKKLSIEQLDLRREAGHRQDELKDKLFVELKDYLANFMETEEYEKFLERQVHWVKDFAGDEVYGGAIARSVKVMENDEINGMRPEQVAEGIVKIAQKRRLPVLATLGGKYKVFCVLQKILPAGLVNRIVGGMYMPKK